MAVRLPAQEALAELLAQILPELQPEVSPSINVHLPSLHHPAQVSYQSVHGRRGCEATDDACVSRRLTQVAFAYFRAFMDTLRREWFGIDRLRLDKYMMLARKFVQQTFEHLRRLDW